MYRPLESTSQDPPLRQGLGSHAPTPGEGSAGETGDGVVSGVVGASVAGVAGEGVGSGVIGTSVAGVTGDGVGSGVTGASVGEGSGSGVAGVAGEGVVSGVTGASVSATGGGVDGVAGVTGEGVVAETGEGVGTGGEADEGAEVGADVGAEVVSGSAPCTHSSLVLDGGSTCSSTAVGSSYSPLQFAWRSHRRHGERGWRMGVRSVPYQRHRSKNESQLHLAGFWTS